METLTLNIIYDNRRVERFEPLMNELKRQGITDYKLWEPVADKKSVVRSINLSHKQIVSWAMEQRLKEVAISEDDVWFPAIDGWQYFLQGKPHEYDMYLGGCYSRTGESNIQDWSIMESGIVRAERWHKRVSGFVGLHCYIIHSRYYATFLNTPDDKHIDTVQEGLGDFRLCYPMAALQRPGFSANNMAHANYNTVLKTGDVYGGLHNVS